MVFTVFQNMTTVLILEWIFWATYKNIVIFQGKYNEAPINPQMISPMFIQLEGQLVII